MSTVLEEEIEDLAEKLEKLQRSSDAKDFEVKKCSNFDKQTSLLQRRLEKLGGISDKCVKEIQEIAEASLSINTSCSVGKSSVSNRRCNKFMDVRSLYPLFVYQLREKSYMDTKKLKFRWGNHIRRFKWVACLIYFIASICRFMDALEFFYPPFNC